MKSFITMLLLLWMQTGFAALPPEYQNEKDLKVLVQFIQQHPKVIATLDWIDFKTLSVHFNSNCQAQFTRKHAKKPDGWVGPADPLVFDKSNCKLD